MAAAAQAVEHYEIARYGTLCSWAEALGHADVHKLLGATLEQEETCDKTLSQLALSTLHAAAIEGGDEDDSNDDAKMAPKSGEKPKAEASKIFGKASDDDIDDDEDNVVTIKPKSGGAKGSSKASAKK